MLTLCDIRRSYLPRIPQLLQDPLSVGFKEIEGLEVSRDIAPLFPLTSPLSTVRGVRRETTSYSPLSIGVVFSGGPASGGHNVISGIFDTLATCGKEHKLLGFLGGPGSLISGEHRELKASDIKHFRNQGGFDLLGSGRYKITTPEQFQAVLETVQKLKLSGLVIIGGDDSNTNAANLSEYFLKEKMAISVIGVPKTIDGDIQNLFVPISFGFDTAAKIYSEMIGNLAQDTLSSLKYFHFVKLMGRSSSYLTLECALKTHPNIVLIAEEKKPLSTLIAELADCVEKRTAQNRPYGIVLVPEGLLETTPNLSLPQGERDSYGNINLSNIETEKFLMEEVQKEMTRRNFNGKFQPIAHFYGYEGRCGHPSNFDANYSYALGVVAALLVGHHKTALMAYVGKLDRPVAEWTFGGTAFPPLLKIGPQGAVIGKAFVDLRGPAFAQLEKKRAEWIMHSSYQNLGPIQFEGAAEVTDSVPLILQ